jgi:hypothetical protein
MNYTSENFHITITNTDVFLIDLSIQWIAVPFALNHKALHGRSIFFAGPLTDSNETSSLAASSSVLSSSMSVNGTEQSTIATMAAAATDYTLVWIGSLKKDDIGIWIDSALLLVFGGIPWQVSTGVQTLSVSVFVSTL